MKNLAAALIKVQSQLKPAKKESENPYFKSKYADLHSIWDSVRSILSDSDLCVAQTTSFHDGHFFLTTHLLHSSGESLVGDYLIKPSKEDPQAYGSAITYARRYALAAILGVVTEDDDGEGAVNHAPEAVKTQATPATPSATTSGNFKFVPQDIKSRPWAKGDKSGMSYSIKSSDGTWYSTLSEKIAEQARQAMEQNRQLEGTFAMKGDYKNIIDAAMAVPF